jgi:phage tail-like protein
VIPDAGITDDLVLGHRFGVFFLGGAGGLLPANPLDFRFQRVSGLASTVSTTAYEEGGQNFFRHTLPERVTHEPLVLERGVVVGSLLDVELSVTLNAFRFDPVNVLVTVFDEQKRPLVGWMFNKAYPISWSTSDLDAGQREVAIDRLELAYTRMSRVGL